MNRFDWLKVGTFVVGLFVASGIPAAVHLGSMNAELREAKARVEAAENATTLNRQQFNAAYEVLWKELREINTRLSRIEGFLKN